jgi:hypothetical protein
MQIPGRVGVAACEAIGSLEPRNVSCVFLQRIEMYRAEKNFNEETTYASRV